MIAALCPVVVPALWCEPAPIPAPPPAVERPDARQMRAVLTGGVNRIKPVTRRGAEVLLARFPQLRVIGGWRANGYGAPDHPRGWALDPMTYDNRRLGNRIAVFLMNNAERHRVSYVMWRHRIWNHSLGEKPRPIRKWRWVPDRGSPTANHLDHVHVTYDRRSRHGR